MVMRTSVGNVITEKLAAGMARTLIRNLSKATHDATQLMAHSPRSQQDRRKILNEFMRAGGPGCYGMKSRNKFTTASCVTFSGMSKLEQDSDIGMLFITCTCFDMSAKRLKKRPDSPISGTFVLASVNRHVVSRLVQRSGIKTESALSTAMGKISGWAVAALKDQDPAPFYIPVETGVFCVRMKEVTQKNKLTGDQNELLVPDITTFIGLDDMSTTNRRIWDELVGLGALQNPFPSHELTFVVPHESALLLDRSREMGREWADRTNTEIPSVDQLEL